MYSLKLQLHDYNNTDTIIRIDSAFKMEKAFQSIFANEFNQEPFEVTYPKNIFLTGPLSRSCPQQVVFSFIQTLLFITPPSGVKVCNY